MDKSNNKSKIYMIFGICILCLSIVGSTIAYYTYEFLNINASTITYGLDYYINYAKGEDITAATLVGTSSYTEGTSADIELWKIDDTYDIYGHIYLDINTIGTNLANSSALKYTVVNNNTVISEGTLKGSVSGQSVLVKSNIPLETTKNLYTVYIWLDETELSDASIEGETLSLTVRCEATMKPIAVTVNLIEHITDLYNPNTTEVNNNITYNLDSVNRLMEDESGNIRYYGISDDNLKNYIYFNCSDYSKQDSTTCETWRIIGMVDGKIKIVRETSVGNSSWDYDYNDDGVSTTYDNNWNTATLQKLLNTAYYKGEDTEHYNNSTTATSFFFKSAGTGLKNDDTRNMISYSLWYLGACDSGEIFSDEAYQCERGENVVDGNSTTWNGNIALMYPSDVGYASDLTKCKGDFESYNDNTDCKSNNWLFTSSSSLLIHRLTTDENSLWALISSTGSLTPSSAPWTLITYANPVRPTLYLKNDIKITDGDGSSSKPYQLAA